MADDDAPTDVSDDDFHERLRRNQRIQDTAASEGWAHITEVANEKRAALQHRLAFGGCKDFDDYQRTVAEFNGIGFVLAIPETIAAHVEQIRVQRAEDREEDPPE